MLLYLHIPFCRSKCRYCAFASGPFDAQAMQTYVALIIRELSFWGQRLPHRGVETIYFGGGTPSLLPADDLARILETLFSRFDVAPDAEITLEANPDSAHDPEYLQSIRSQGVNRLSLGIQSLCPDQLTILGRRHSSSQALQAFDAARTAGFKNISLDFIWGIPGQSCDDWLGQIDRFAALRPEHLSCYGLSVEPGTPLEQDVLQKKVMLPDDDTQARMFLEGSALLRTYGYEHYEISNYALPGHQSRHNSGYWQRKDYLGLGPSAVSTVGGKRWQNPETLSDYKIRVHQNTLGAHPEPLDPVTLRNEEIMLCLRTARGLDLQAFKRNYGIDFLKTHQYRIEALHKNDLAHITEKTLCLTPQGMLVSNDIIAGFLDAPH